MDELVKRLSLQYGFINAVFMLTVGFGVYLAIKHRLKHDIEKIRSDFKIDEITHQIRYGSLYQKVAETIAEGHAKLVMAKRNLAGLVSYSGMPTDELAGKAEQSLMEFYEWFDLHRIYLTHGTCEKIQQFVDKYIKISIDVEVGVLMVSKSKKGISGRAFQDLQQARKDFRKNLEPLLRELENEFRRIIGLENAKGHN